MPWGPCSDWSFDRETIESLESWQPAVFALLRPALAPVMRGRLPMTYDRPEHILIGHTRDLRHTLLGLLENPEPCLRAWNPTVWRAEMELVVPVELRARRLITEFRPTCNCGRLPVAVLGAG